jgi:hypothetical protein
MIRMLDVYGLLYLNADLIGEAIKLICNHKRTALETEITPKEIPALTDCNKTQKITLEKSNL